MSRSVPIELVPLARAIGRTLIVERVLSGHPQRRAVAAIVLEPIEDDQVLWFACRTARILPPYETQTAELPVVIETRQV